MNREFQEFDFNDNTPQSEINILINNLLDELKERCPKNRELSIVKTKLEEACFFANKSLLIDRSYTNKNIPTP